MANLKVFSLDGCYYSKSAEELLDDNKIIYSLQKVSHMEKDDIKDINKMYTFPQIYLEYQDSKIIIGGYSELNEIYDIINKKNNLDDTIVKVLEIVKLPDDKYSKKQIFKLIDILVKK